MLQNNLLFRGNGVARRLLPQQLTPWQLLITKNSLVLMTPLQGRQYLGGCRRYQPSAAVLSAISDALLTQRMPDPISLSQQLLSVLGSFTTCVSAPL